MNGSESLTLLDTPERLASALPGLRRRVLERLRTPASASELAREFGLPRQNLNYHLRVLEAQGLLELVEIRQRRGFAERVLGAVGDALVIDPALLAGPARAGSKVAERDRHAAAHLVGVAATTVRDVARMSTEADRRGQRLLTFTLETEVRFASPSDVHRFTDALAAAMQEVAATFAAPDGRAYRVFAAGHPTAAPARTPSTAVPAGSTDDPGGAA